MPSAEILRYEVDGTVHSTPIVTTDDTVRGGVLTGVLNAASAGETILVPPGSYQLTNVTRDGVKIELMEGVLLYTNGTQPGNLINVTSGEHFIAGFGRLHSLYSGGTSGHVIQHTGGTLVCVAQEVFSSAKVKEAVTTDVASATESDFLSLDVQTIRSTRKTALRVANDSNCIIRVLELISASAVSGSSHALEVSGGHGESRRDILIMRAEANAGIPIRVAGNGRVTVSCMAAYGDKNYAVFGSSDFQVIHVMFAKNSGTLPTVKIEKGIARIQHVLTQGNIHAVELCEGTHLSADFIDGSAGGVKILAVGDPDDSPVLDVARIRLGLPTAFAVFAIGDEQSVCIVRDYRSLNAMSNVNVVDPNHPG